MSMLHSLAKKPDTAEDTKIDAFTFGGKDMNKKIWAIILAVAGVIAAAGIVFALVSKKK